MIFWLLSIKRDLIARSFPEVEVQLIAFFGWAYDTSIFALNRFFQGCTDPDPCFFGQKDLDPAP